MKVSVVIPAYNEENYIEKCLKALSNQTVKADEIIVVDNKSHDKTAEVAKRLGAKVINESKQGASYARNTGFDKASGDIIARTDADTIVPKNWIEKIKKDFSDPEVGIVCGGVVYYGRLLNPLSHFLIFWVDDIFGYKAITGPNFGIRKSVWEKVRREVHMDNSRYHEDLDLAIHAQKYGRTFRDYSLMVNSSSRKFSDFNAFFVDYPKKWLITIFHKKHRELSHNPIMKRF